MNIALRALAHLYLVSDSDDNKLALRLGFACVNRARHLLIDETVLSNLDVGLAFVDEQASVADFAAAKAEVVRIARIHPGTNSIDGAGSAAVSSTFAVSRAFEGAAVDAAEYTAYALVYSYASYSVTDPGAYESEYGWQVECWKKILQELEI